MNYLTSKDLTVHKHSFDQGIQDMIDGKCSVRGKQYNTPLSLADGTRINPMCLLEYFINKTTGEGFNYDKAVSFVEPYRKLMGWKTYTAYPLHQWYKRVILEPFFLQIGDEWSHVYQRRDDVDWQLVNQDEILRFLCYMGVCYMKYGASFDSLNANEIFGVVTQMGSDEVKRLKKYGTGELPAEWIDFKNDKISFKANDVFATFRITLKEESEELYALVFDGINRILEKGFPGSYSIDFRSPEKNYLPIKGLPKKGINQLFANAVKYESLRPKIEKYARLAMKEDEWYTHLEGEYSAMPSTFAVLALALEDEKYFPLLMEYMRMCDEEHSAIQTKFTSVFLAKYGLTAKTLPVFLFCLLSFQDHPHDKIFKQKVCSPEGMKLLLDFRINPEKYLPADFSYGWRSKEEAIEHFWNTLICVCLNVRGVADPRVPQELKNAG